MVINKKQLNFIKKIIFRFTKEYDMYYTIVQNLDNDTIDYIIRKTESPKELLMNIIKDIPQMTALEYNNILTKNVIQEYKNYIHNNLYKQNINNVFINFMEENYGLNTYNLIQDIIKAIKNNKLYYTEEYINKVINDLKQRQEDALYYINKDLYSWRFFNIKMKQVEDPKTLNIKFNRIIQEYIKEL